MDGGSQIHGWLVSQPCISLPPPILGVYYWYWHIIEYIFCIMGSVFSIAEVLFQVASREEVNDAQLCTDPNATSAVSCTDTIQLRNAES